MTNRSNLVAEANKRAEIEYELEKKENSPLVGAFNRLVERGAALGA